MVAIHEPSSNNWLILRPWTSRWVHETSFHDSTANGNCGFMNSTTPHSTGENRPILWTRFMYNKSSYSKMGLFFWLGTRIMTISWVFVSFRGSISITFWKIQALSRSKFAKDLASTGQTILNPTTFIPKQLFILNYFELCVLRGTTRISSKFQIPPYMAWSS